MELSLFQLLTGVAIFWSYLSYSRNVDQTDMNKILSGILWMAVGFNSFSIHYYLPNGSISSYTAFTDTGVENYWLLIMGVIYFMLGAATIIQVALDRVLHKKINEVT